MSIAVFIYNTRTDIEDGLCGRGGRTSESESTCDLFHSSRKHDLVSIISIDIVWIKYKFCTKYRKILETYQTRVVWYVGVSQIDPGNIICLSLTH